MIGNFGKVKSSNYIVQNHNFRTLECLPRQQYHWMIWQSRMYYIWLTRMNIDNLTPSHNIKEYLSSRFIRLLCSMLYCHILRLEGEQNLSLALENRDINHLSPQYTLTDTGIGSGYILHLYCIIIIIISSQRVLLVALIESSHGTRVPRKFVELGGTKWK